jgi:ubiquitin-activating enzyme E1 C
LRALDTISADPTSYFGKIQDHPASFYGSFDIIIAGLDSIPARRWINATLVEIAEQDENVTPLIDGGTEGMPSHSLEQDPG